MTDTHVQEPLHELARWRPHWILEKWHRTESFDAGRAPDEVAEFDGNLLLNVGIGNLWDLACGLSTPTTYSNANARLAVGDSTTAAAATQTGLQAATNKTYKAMNATYPSLSTNQVSFQSTFGSADANYAWNEFCVDNGTATQSLNRLQSGQGTKASGSTWQLTLQITIS